MNKSAASDRVSDRRMILVLRRWGRPRLPLSTQRLLHSRYARDTTSILSTSALCKYGSPAHGLLLGVSPALPALWELGGMCAKQSAALLTRQLWHRHEPQEPLRHTRNLSLPAAHLAANPSMQGVLFGLALSDAPLQVQKDVLRAKGVAALARKTKVSMARFLRLVDLIRAGLTAPDHVDIGATASPVVVSTATVMLAFLWSTARSKQCLLDFYEAAEKVLPSGGLLGGEYDATCKRWRSHWVQSSFGPGAANDGTPLSRQAAASLVASAETEGTSADTRDTARAIELLGYVLGARGSDRPLVEQSRHTYKGGREVADCVEVSAVDWT